MNQYFVVSITQGGTFDIVVQQAQPIVVSISTANAPAPTPDLQQVTDVDNNTTNDIELVNTASIIFGSSSELILPNNSRLREGTIDAGLGGQKGIAQICGVGYELKWEAGRLYVMNGSGDGIRWSLYNFNIPPTATDDDTKGYAVGSLWTLDDNTIYLCSDATTNAAVWTLQTAPAPNLQEVTDSGSITTNAITVGDTSGIYSEVGDSYVGTENTTTDTYAYIASDGSLGLSNGTHESTLKNTNVTTTGIILEYPDKPAGSYTIATTDIIPNGTVTSVSATVPSPTNPAFSVNVPNPNTTPSIDITANGIVSQYVRGDGSLANFPASSGGGASVNYYLNGSVNQGTFGGNTYYEMSKVPIIGGGTNFTRTNGSGNGYIASFITDAGDPSFLNIPAGNWNLEFYFQSSSSGGSPQFYGEIYKVSASNVFTLVASGSTNPEGITNGTTVDQYFTSIPVPQTSLLVTDRLAIRIYVITGGRTITLHTENGNLCQILTTFTTGLTALNGLTDQVQNFASGTSGTDFGISSSGSTHTFNLPTASATNRGALSSSDWTTFNSKVSTTLSISTSSPLSGGGDLSANRTISIADAAADGSTKGAATFTANDFNSLAGVISLDYTNGQKATALLPGFLSAADWSTFNAKQENIIKLVKLGVDQTTTSTTAQNDTELTTSALEANKTYAIYCRLRVGNNGAGGSRLGWNLPSGATGNVAILAPTSALTALQIGGSNNSVLSTVSFTQNLTSNAYIIGSFTMGATVGTTNLIFASGTSGQTTTILGSGGSFAILIKMN